MDKSTLPSQSTDLLRKEAPREDPLRVPRSQFLDGYAGKLLNLSIFGILLYMVFSIPATYFYSHLGTSPGEVGLTYASILSGSTLGALVIVGGILLFVYYAINIILSSAGYYFLFRRVVSRFRNPDLATNDWWLDDCQFERKLKLTKKRLPGNPALWDQFETASRHRRKLGQLWNPTPEQALEMKAIASTITKLEIKHYSSYVARLFRPSRRHYFGVFLLIIAVTAGLARFAVDQADQVSKGNAEFVGNRLALFEYHAEPVTIRSTSAADEQDIQQLVGAKRVYLLGQNSQYVILYVLNQGLTVRIPAASVIITSSAK